MSTSLKRHPSGEPEESPEAKRTKDLTKEMPDITPINLANTLLKQPTQVEGCSMTDSISQADKADPSKTTSIINTGFKLSTGTALFSNGKSESNSNNIFAQALASNSNSIFGQAATGNSTGGGFLFGKNLSDRAVTVTPSTEEAKPASSTEKHTFTETKVTSGEEDEKRLLQTNCKLYQFCSTKKVWLERGGGTLRLNECTTGKSSRLVVRSSAVMKVMLNTRIFADMFINRPNASTLRISAQDDGKMSTFLLKCSKIECDKLYNLLIKKRELERDYAEDEAGESSKEVQEETNGEKSNGSEENGDTKDAEKSEKSGETEEKSEKESEGDKGTNPTIKVDKPEENSSKSDTTEG